MAGSGLFYVTRSYDPAPRSKPDQPVVRQAALVPGEQTRRLAAEAEGFQRKARAEEEDHRREVEAVERAKLEARRLAEQLAEAKAAERRRLEQYLADLSSTDRATRVGAALALGRVGKPVVPELVQELGAPNPEARRSAAMALGYIGPDARESVPYLVFLSQRDPVQAVRDTADTALGRINR